MRIKNPRPLAETDCYVLFQEYEQAFLFDKDENKELWRADFYGDPSTGLIDIQNQWALVGGDKLLLWYKNELQFVEDTDLVWIFDMRQVSLLEAEILTDPWGANPAIWKFNISLITKQKIRGLYRL